MPRRDYKKKISRTLKYSEIYNSKEKYAGGGITNPTPHLPSEMWVEIMDDPFLDENGHWEVTGRPQIHIGGTRAAFEEMGLLFLALAHYFPPEPGYSTSLELDDETGKSAIHFVVHLPSNSSEKERFSKVQNIASGILDENGDVIVTKPLNADE